ncbi:neprilysin-1-like isoform X2 [Mercenaria mercenaria]|uniref:neprilysin-1-like isoform X2 n=1 Tax=Mercenaria mercenaria TaxID=6596 RepID=UPI00234EF33B|nr:neprilysin-1-like isoform X2 [Mercenaria mercenaria]
MTVDGNIPNTVDEVLQGAVTRFELSPFFKMSTVMILNEEGINVHALKESFRYVEGLTQLLNSYISTLGSRRKRQAPEGSSNSTEEYGKIFDKVLRAYFIETNISKILENTTSVSDLLYTTLSYTYSNLKEVYPSIPWDAATGISRDVPVLLVNPDYFHALDNLWSNLDEEDMKLFVFMNVLVKRVLPYTTLSLRSLLSDIGAKGDMVYTDIDCVEHSLNLANEEIHAIYIGQFTQKVLRNRLKLTDIKNKVSDAFQKYLSASTWIQPDLDRAVSALARNIKMHFSPLKSTVQQTMNVSGQSFLSLAIELHRQKHAFEINRLGSKATEITMDWTSAKVYFDAHFNAIGFPSGLTIYLTEGEPPFDIYGYIGMMMTEEFIKVLTGPLTGGIPPLWWGTTNTLAFNDVRQCFSSQLPTFQNKFYDIGNVMILNGAFQVIDQVYLTDSINTDRVIEGTSITENVIFILNVAQLHCQLNDGSYRQRLTRERINNVMMNNVNFKRMFSCPDPSPLVSDNTCSLFL